MTSRGLLPVALCRPVGAGALRPLQQLPTLRRLKPEGCAWQGLRKMSPFCIPFAIANMGGAQLAMDLGFMGPNYPINTACATGNYCILSCAVPPPLPFGPILLLERAGRI